jgi:copper chaperone CopZ
MLVRRVRPQSAGVNESILTIYGGSSVMFDAHYLHILDGRLRIRVPEVKRSPDKARHVEETLQSMSGITHVKANPMTGSVLVLFESQVVTHDHIVEKLRSIQCLSITRIRPQHNDNGRGIGDVLIRSVAELLVERAIVALL